MLKVRSRGSRREETLGETAQPFDTGRADRVSATAPERAIGSCGSCAGNLDAEEHEGRRKARHGVVVAAAEVEHIAALDARRYTVDHRPLGQEVQPETRALA